MEERLSLLYGKENIQYLSHQTVLVIGVGGVGGSAVEALARSSIGTLILVDFDCVSSSNINRQIIALNSTIGKKKTECFQERIHEINPQCKVYSFPIKITSENISTFSKFPISFILDACDDTSAKLAIAKWAQTKKIPHLMALGAGNRVQPNKVEITTLAKTKEDALARKMRNLFRKEKLSLEIPVVCSKEKPIVHFSSPIASSIFVPSTAGLFAANYIITFLLEQKEKNLSK